VADDRIIEISPSDLEVMLDEAAERGAKQALRSMGLNDDAAQNDLRDLRGLLASWREVRKSAMDAAVKVLTTAILGAVLLAIGIKIGGVSVAPSPPVVIPAPVPAGVPKTMLPIH
jgi:hypothetical protein